MAYFVFCAGAWIKNKLKQVVVGSGYESGPHAVWLKESEVGVKTTIGEKVAGALLGTEERKDLPTIPLVVEGKHRIMIAKLGQINPVSCDDFESCGVGNARHRWGATNADRKNPNVRSHEFRDEVPRLVR